MKLSSLHSAVPAIAYLMLIVFTSSEMYGGTGKCLNATTSPPVTPPGCGSGGGCDNDQDPTAEDEEEMTDCNISSIIKNNRLIYMHDAVDYIASPLASSSCSSCLLGDAKVGRLPSLEVKRRIDLGYSANVPNYFLSFGKFGYWQGYDSQLIFSGGRVFRSTQTQLNRGSLLTFDNVKQAWIDRVSEQIFGLYLYDAAGLPIVVEQAKSEAKTAVVLRNDGITEHYQMIADNSGKIRGRLVALLDRNDNAITFEYLLEQPTESVRAVDAHLYYQMVEQSQP